MPNGTECVIGTNSTSVWIAGDTSVAHTWAYAAMIEAITGTAVLSGIPVEVARA